MRYQLTIWVTGLVLFGALGGWLAMSPDVPVVWRAGALLGLAVGAVAVSLFSRALTDQPAKSHP